MIPVPDHAPEAEKVYRNLNGDCQKIAHYIIARCGQFVYDLEREAFIAEFLKASSHSSVERLRQQTERELCVLVLQHVPMVEQPEFFRLITLLSAPSGRAPAAAPEEP